MIENFPFINLKDQYKEHQNEILLRIQNTLNSSKYFLGSNTYALEKTLSEYTNSYAISCINATAAILITLIALGVKHNDEIITSSFTFKAIPQAIKTISAKPIFVDVNPKSFNVLPQQIEKAINKNTKAIIHPNTFGAIQGTKEINKIAKQYKIPIIEDAAQCFSKDKLHYNIKINSFYPAKNLGAYGHAGAILSNDKNFINTCKDIRNQNHKRAINAKIDEIQAAILNVKLKYFEEEQKKRINIAKIYNEALRPLRQYGLKLQEHNHCYSVYALRHKKRKKIISLLNKENIPTKIYYEQPLHSIYYKNHKNDNKQDMLFPNTKAISKEIFALPLCPYLSQANQTKTINSITKIIKDIKHC